MSEIRYAFNGAQTGSGVISGGAGSASISAEGVTTLLGFARDNAGNQGSVSIATVKIDRTAPHTTAAVPSDWKNDSAVVQLNSTDNLSGLKTTYFRLDGAAPQIGTRVVVGAAGNHTLVFWSVDNAGNIELDHFTEFAIVGTQTYKVFMPIAVH